MANNDENQPGAGVKPPAPANPAAASSGPAEPASGMLLWIVLAALLVVGVVVFVVAQRKGKAAAEGKAAAAAKAGAMPVSVVVGTVASKDVPIYLDGLGTVQAFNTVTIHSRVDGQLQKLAFTEGQDVHAGDLLAQIDPDPFRTQVEQAEAKKAQDDAQLAFARVELKRDADLLATHILSQEVFDTQQASVRQLEAAVKSDQATIDNFKVQLNYCTITAPIDGRAGIRFVDQGNIVHANDANGIVVLAQLRPISVMFTLPEQSLSEIQKQMAAGQLTVLAVDRDNRTLLDTGKLEVIDNQIDTTTGTIRLKTTFPNQDLKLWPGQFVNARLLLTLHKDGNVVPASVIQRGPDGAYAFVVKDDMTVQMRPVKVGQIDKEQALIEEGLKPGEKVVVDGQYKLQPGSTVKPVDSARPGGGGTNRAAGPELESGSSGKKRAAKGTNAPAK